MVKIRGPGRTGCEAWIDVEEVGMVVLCGDEIE
jgi:hypothetical protein